MFETFHFDPQDLISFQIDPSARPSIKTDISDTSGHVYTHTYWTMTRAIFLMKSWGAVVYMFKLNKLDLIKSKFKLKT